jgi:two-component sensor histidine kinase
MDEVAAAGSARAPEVSDLWPRLLISPFLGLILPNVSGLIDNRAHSTASLLASYAYFALVAFVIWEGNRRLYFRMQRREDWLRRPLKRLGALLAAILLYSIPVAALLLWVWRQVTGDRGTNAYAVPMALLGTVTVVVIITHVYETVFLLRDWESDRLRSARMEQARLEAELEALGREVDPHFLFNSLNALAHLIDQRRAGASEFVNALSTTYRYVLDARGRRLVPLSEELDALRRHETLAAIRFGSAIALAVDIDSLTAARLQLPPVTLGELFQNAIKHNAVGPDKPLAIRVSVEGNTLLFANDVCARHVHAASTGIGLKNLSQRFKLAVGREVTWREEGGRFVVRLPIVS